MMKHLAICSVGAIAFASLLLANNLPLLANFSNAETGISLNFQRQLQFHFHLKAEKKIVQLKHPTTRHRVTWQSLQGDTMVYRGDVIRYIVSGKNNSDRSVKYLVVTQPIPKQTTYILNSVTTKNNEAKLAYSIDNGKSFVEKPIVQLRLADGRVKIRPAPATLYTHLRWKYNELIGPATVVNATFQVEVR